MSAQRHSDGYDPTDTEAQVRRAPVQKRTTLLLEEGKIAAPNDDRSNTEEESSGASGGSGEAGLNEKARQDGTNADDSASLRRRSLMRDPSIASQGAGLGGPVSGPPRRMTTNSLEGRRPQRSFTSLFQPERGLRPAPSRKQSAYNIITYTWLNLLLLLIPISWVLHFVLDKHDPKSSIAIFMTSFLAIMPLAGLLSYGTEEVALRVGQTLGGLINATLGNAVELIVAIIALFHCELVITQTSLVGSVLSNLLLVLGMCFFVGGLRYKEQEFKQTAAQLNTGMLTIAVISVLVPASFHATLGDDIPDPTERPDILQMSRGASIILLIIYVGYLYFQLKSHVHLYADDDGEPEEPTLEIWMAGGLLVLSTVLVGVTSEWLVDSIDGFTYSYHINKTFVGLVLLPIVSNAAEHVTAVVAARKNAVDLAMGVAVGSSIQIAIFVIPLLVIIAWIADKPLSLLFDPFVAILMFLAVLIVAFAIADGRSNYMEGWILMNVFVLMALASWYVPDVGNFFSDAYCHNRNAPQFTNPANSTEIRLRQLGAPTSGIMDPSRLVEVHPERVGATSSPHFPNHNASNGSKVSDHRWSLDSFRQNVQARVTRRSEWRVEFDLVGVDASIANAIRRVLMAEVPTVAIETVFVSNNTSIIVDEVLSHRLGLVPLRINPDKLEWREPDDQPTDRNTLVFHLDVACKRDGLNDITGGKVYSSSLTWDPKVNQADEFKDDPPQPVHQSILLAKLRPGQGIKMELHCVKGIGKDHAKFSPVSTASYRLLPHIDIPDPSSIAPEDIPKFVGCFPPGVIGVQRHKTTGREQVFVKNARKDTVSREVLRHKEFADKVKLGRVRDHFLFDVESTGCMPPEVLLPAAIRVLVDKVQAVRKSVDRLQQKHGHGGGSLVTAES